MKKCGVIWLIIYKKQLMDLQVRFAPAKSKAGFKDEKPAHLRRVNLVSCRRTGLACGYHVMVAAFTKTTPGTLPKVIQPYRQDDGQPEWPVTRLLFYFRSKENLSILWPRLYRNHQNQVQHCFWQCYNHGWRCESSVFLTGGVAKTIGSSRYLSLLLPLGG
jgi:hypothetical protein